MCKHKRDVDIPYFCSLSVCIYGKIKGHVSIHIISKFFIVDIENTYTCKDKGLAYRISHIPPFNVRAGEVPMQKGGKD